MVTPLAVTIRTPELTGDARTIWKRAYAAPYALTASHYVNYATPLDKDGINIRGTIRGNLSRRDSAS